MCVQKPCAYTLRLQVHVLRGGITSVQTSCAYIFTATPTWRQVISVQNSCACTYTNYVTEVCSVCQNSRACASSSRSPLAEWLVLAQLSPAREECSACAHGDTEKCMRGPRGGLATSTVVNHCKPES